MVEFFQWKQKVEIFNDEMKLVKVEFEKVVDEL